MEMLPLTIAFFFAALAGVHSSPTPPPANISAVNLTAAAGLAGPQAQFCIQQGGMPKLYQMFQGMPPKGLRLGTPLPSCVFNNEAGSNVYIVGLDTLAAKYPTLAVLAWNSMTPYKPQKDCQNPSECYCAQLYGEGSAMNNAAPNLGWWTPSPMTPTSPSGWYGANDFCIFADRSAIDTWTLFYHGNANTTTPSGDNSGIPDGAFIKFGYQPPVTKKQSTLGFFGRK